MRRSETALEQIALVLLAGMVVGCAPDDLTRARAQSVLDAHSEFASAAVVGATQQARADGYEQGYWNERGQISGKSSEFYDWQDGSALRLSRPIRRRVRQIDGIADALSQAGAESRGMKEVQFRWEYEEVSAVVRRFIPKGGTGTAFLRRFDDGWRVASLTLTSGSDAFAPTRADQDAAESDRRSEAERRRAEQQHLADESRRLAKLSGESARRTRVVMAFDAYDSFAADEDDRFPSPELTDVDLFGRFGLGRIVRVRMQGERATGSRAPWKAEVSYCAPGERGSTGKAVWFKDEAGCRRFAKALNASIIAWRAKYGETTDVQYEELVE